MPDPSGSHDRLEAIVAEYHIARDAGKVVDWRDLLKQYPDLAAEITRYFEVEADMNQFVDPLRRDPSTPTLPPRKTRTAAPKADAFPMQFGHYKLVAEIARGGMGVVYRAMDLTLRREVALKAISGGPSASEEDTRRFTLETEAAAQLDHPNIVPIYEVGEQDGRQFFAMKLVEGGSLAEHIGYFHGKPKEAARLLEQVARAVHFAHERGVLHRDLKPANVLLQTQGELAKGCTPYVADFGLAKRMEVDSQITQSGAIVGTPSYMAPEQALGQTLSPRTDVFSLGAILYHILTRRRPFQAETPMATIIQVQQKDPERPSSINPKVETDLETICMKCLEKDPSMRYESALELAEDLRRYQAEESIHARPATWIQRTNKWCRRQPLVAALSGALFVAVVAALGLLAWNLSRPRVPTVPSPPPMESSEYFRIVRDAYEELRLGHAEKANELLESCPKELRGCEWYWIRGGAPRMIKAAGEVLGLAFHPKKDWLAAASADGTVQVWDLDTNQSPFKMTAAHADGARCVAFDPDGTLLASAGGDGALKLWNLSEGKLIHQVKGQDGMINRIAFDPTGKAIGIAGQSGHLVIWSPATEKIIKDLPVCNNDLPALAMGPNGLAVAVSGGIGDGRVHWLDTKTWKESTGEAHMFPAMDLAFNPKSAVLMSVAIDGNIRALHPKDRELREQVVGTMTSVSRMAFTADGERLLTFAMTGGDVRIWDTHSWKSIVDIGGKSDATIGRAIAVSSNGKYLATTGAETGIRIWQGNAVSPAP